MEFVFVEKIPQNDEIRKTFNKLNYIPISTERSLSVLASKGNPQSKGQNKAQPSFSNSNAKRKYAFFNIQFHFDLVRQILDFKILEGKREICLIICLNLLFYYFISCLGIADIRKVPKSGQIL